MDAAAARHPEVVYDPQLIDAVFALLLQSTGEGLVIPALNRDGDTLSDLVMQMFGSVAGAESLVINFDEAFNPAVVLAEAPHGTAPRLFGKNLANPMAMILAAAALYSHMPGEAAGTVSRAMYESTFEAVAAGVRTVDLGGAATTTEFTNEVIRRVRAKLEVWRGLGRF